MRSQGLYRRPSGGDRCAAHNHCECNLLRMQGRVTSDLRDAGCLPLCRGEAGVEKLWEGGGAPDGDGREDGQPQLQQVTATSRRVSDSKQGRAEMLALFICILVRCVLLPLSF